ncbi:beta-galactosidase [Shewanella frigidimarina]|uniref:Agarase n=1 Tax=Shewanella frigidimarina TaxID=56812 RepID=A0A106BZ58_SHEFR|nr:carbohydrate binding domain-containing protein [Shewanella frigidimarina]KVX01292.1 agarase [Shewanella frigidimarina]
MTFTFSPKYSTLSCSILLSLTVISGCSESSTSPNVVSEASNANATESLSIQAVNTDLAMGNVDVVKVLYDFEHINDDSFANVDLTAANSIITDSIVTKNATTSIISTPKSNALEVKFDTEKSHIASVDFIASTAWDWSGHTDLAIAVDITNPSSASTPIYVKAADDMHQQSRSTVIPAASSNTYYIVLSGDELDQNTGIRSNPKYWLTDFEPIEWRGGEKQLDLSKMTSIHFELNGSLVDKALVFDNIRLITPKAVNSEYLVGLVDQFGQRISQDFNGKVSSVEQLQRDSDNEIAALALHPQMDDRSKFNGWLNGPKLKASGYYRVDKYQGKWTLVDPEGYVFFSNGIANIRLANTSTITGYDFDPGLINIKLATDFTPEDSLGLNQVDKQALPSRKLMSPLRANMFTSLPNYDEPLGQNFGYRRSVHSGALTAGETFSFYRANLQRKFGLDDPEQLFAKWQDNTINRMRSWGFTSFGNWVDPQYYQMNRYPYFANGWIIGDFKTVSSGNDYWSPLPDPFDPVFTERARATIAQIAKEVDNNPWCVGVFIDNEKSWGMMDSLQNQYGIVLNTMTRPIADSPAKVAFVSALKQKYSSIDNLNTAWALTTSWDEIANGITLDKINDAVKADLSMLLTLYAEQYFKTVNATLKEHMPNHLYMGARFASWGMTPEVRAAAAKYADVVSYNYYKEGLDKGFWTFLDEVDRPSIIGEFHNGSLDSGLLHPGLVPAQSQADRGKMYQQYMKSVINNQYFVGAHWFQYIDSPLTGRSYDGENYNVGFVSVTDKPYKELVDAAKEVNRTLYINRFKEEKPANK